MLELLLALSVVPILVAVVMFINRCKHEWEIKERGRRQKWNPYANAFVDREPYEIYQCNHCKKMKCVTVEFPP